MRRYLLDTAPLAGLLLGRPVAVDLITPWMHRHEVVTSIVVYGEVIEYIKSRQDFERRRASLRALLQEIRPYLLSYSITERYADIRRMMRPPYGPGLIGDIDTLIATTALEANLTVVTTDRDLQRVPDLNVILVQLRT